MDASKYRFRKVQYFLSVYMLMATYSHSAEPSADQALRLRPIQADVDFDMPTAEEVKLCTVRANAEPGQAGWYVYSPGGQLLRRFLDTNGDNRLDSGATTRGASRSIGTSIRISTAKRISTDGWEQLVRDGGWMMVKTGSSTAGR
jgi:hypothetical protein